MKYLFIFLLSFIIFTPVFAAKQVSGTVPQVQPLQPAPAGVAPNLSKNIQASPPSYNDYSASGTNQSAGGITGQTGGAGQTGQTAVPGTSIPLVAETQTPSMLFGWLAAILALGIFVLVVYKKNKSQ